MTKWTLADVIEIDSRSSTEAIRDAYSEAGFSGALENKWENFPGPLLGSEGALRTFENAFQGSLTNAVRDFRVIGFF